jgi:hypothetical protein
MYVSPQLEVLKCKGCTLLEKMEVFPNLKELHLFYSNGDGEHPGKVMKLR